MTNKEIIIGSTLYKATVLMSGEVVIKQADGGYNIRYFDNKAQFAEWMRKGQ